jgi:hypothetical protein
MPSQKGKTVVSFGGGWATDFGPSSTNAPQGNSLVVPFFTNLDNATLTLDGGFHKLGGAAKLNSTQVTESGSGVAVQGLIDVWFQGTSGSETQKRFAYIGTKLLKDDADGTWDELTTGLVADREPCFAIFEDEVFWASDSNVDTPRRWDGSAGSTSAVGGTPPTFSFMVTHKNRMWAAGVASAPSRLYYSGSLDANDWVGATAGSIDIDPSDGDRITGLRSHKNELIVFKGPHRQSIHRITGSSPSGSDAFARETFVNGIGSVNHNGIFTINDDLVFTSPRGIHSLAATAAFGDYIEAFLSRPILSYYQDSLNHSVLYKNWGANYSTTGQAIWTMPKSGGSVKNVYLVYDYRFQPGRWISWSKDSAYVAANCLAVIENSARKHRIFAGTTNGYVYEIDRSSHVIDSSTAYTVDVKTPFLNFGTSAHLKTIEDGFMTLRPTGTSTVTFGYTRDRQAEQTIAIDQTVGDTLG